MNAAISHYLSRFAEPESDLPAPSADRFVCVPLRGESPAFVSRLLTSLAAAAEETSVRATVILVLNGAESDCAEWKETQTPLLSRLQGEPYLKESQGPLELFWVDRMSPARAFGPKDGVGLARKIGLDLALRVWQLGSQSPFLWTTDADAQVPLDYFQIKDSETKAAAIHYAYTHEVEGFLGAKAAQLYEASLTHYEKGLKSAGSPYAYAAVGSCLAVSPLAYAQVRGMPKREAGEDFHFLAKVRKVGDVVLRDTNPIRLTGRFSARVPFGTGQGTTKIHELLEQGQTYSFYAPEVFEALGHGLRAAKASLLEEKAWNEIEIPKRFAEAIESEFPAVIEEARRCRKTPEQRLKHFHDVFDGLKTLKWIHHLRDTRFPNVSGDELSQAVGKIHDVL